MAKIGELAVRLKVDADEYSRKVKAAKDQMKSLANDSKKATDKVAGGLSDAAIAAGVYIDKMGKAREANGRFVSASRKVELGLGNIDRSADKANAGVGRLSGNIGALASRLSGLVVAGGGLALFNSQMQEILQVSRMSQALGVATDDLSAFQYAAESVGISGEKAGDILKDVADKINDYLVNGAGEAKDVFEALGLQVEEFIGLSPDKAIEKIGVAMNGLPRGEQVTFMEMLANDATLLLPLLDNNAQKLKELGEQARKSGAVVTEQEAKRAKEFAESWKQVTGEIKAATQEISMAFAPALISAAKATGGIAREFNRMVKQDQTRFDETVKGFEKLGQSGVEDMIRKTAEQIAKLSKIEEPEGFAGLFTRGKYDAAQEDIKMLQERLAQLAVSYDNLQQSAAKAKKTEDEASKARSLAAKAIVKREQEAKEKALKQRESTVSQYRRSDTGAYDMSAIIKASSQTASAYFTQRAAEVARLVQTSNLSVPTSATRVSVALAELGKLAERMRAMPGQYGLESFDAAGAFNVIDAIKQEAGQLAESQTRQAKTFEDFREIFRDIVEANKPDKVGSIEMTVVNGSDKTKLTVTGPSAGLKEVKNLVEKQTQEAARAVAR